jgi:hypothetical protein
MQHSLRLRLRLQRRLRGRFDRCRFFLRREDCSGTASGWRGYYGFCLGLENRREKKLVVV